MSAAASPSPSTSASSVPAPAAIVPTGDGAYQTPYGTLRRATDEQVRAMGLDAPGAAEAPDAVDASAALQAPSAADAPPKPAAKARVRAPPRPQSKGSKATPDAGSEPVDGDDVDDEIIDDDDDDDKTTSRRPITMAFIEDDTKRHIAFSKRKWGLMKKAYELALLTGSHVLLLIVSSSGLVYTFSTPKLRPLVTTLQGQDLIQSICSAPDAEPDSPLEPPSGLAPSGPEEPNKRRPAGPVAAEPQTKRVRREGDAMHPGGAQAYAPLPGQAYMAPVYQGYPTHQYASAAHAHPAMAHAQGQQPPTPHTPAWGMQPWPVQQAPVVRVHAAPPPRP